MTEIAQAPAPVLTDVHRVYLTAHAITDEIIAAQGIRSEGDVIVFTWRDGEHETIQTRPWPGPPGAYLWAAGEAGHPLHLNVIRDPAPDAPVLLCEGTKQSLAAASWMPSEYAVYGMPGCYGWVNSEGFDLSRFAGRDVIIMLDADAAENLNVYEAGERLAAELADEEPPARPAFVPSPAWGKDGIDDYLARLAPARRTEKLLKLISRTQPKPADRKPAHRKMADRAPDNGPLPYVVVNKNRLEVIREIIWHMQQRWNGTQLFSYGGVLTRLRGTTAEPLDKDSFTRWMAEAVATYRYKPPGIASPGSYEAAWPEPQTIGALLASGEEFAPLAGVSRTPFARPDGTICSKNGWDWDPETGTGTQAMLVTGNSGMDRLGQNGELDSPDREHAAMAARFLLDTWLRDMPWRDESSRANALALVLTPFIRGIVPLAPLAVISGLQMGVGKNLLADCISLMTTGENIQPLPWIPDDDDEIRKQILSSFRAGSSLVCFDEAHDIGGASLTRAITATTYADRILGVSKMASYPNRVTWMALGNQVSTRSDMARRVYWIELYPDCPDPQDRPESAFTIPDLRGWTAGNRPELITSALVMIRAWFTAGQPQFPRGAIMGSFEPWDKMMSGILGWAGVPGFLGNLSERRAERDMTGGYWAEHLAWLRAQFGTAEFTALDVRARAMASGGTWDAPPRLDDPGDREWTTDLGKAYAHNQDRWYGPLRLVKSGWAHGKKSQWRVQELGGESTPPTPPSSPVDNKTQPEQDRRSGRSENQAVQAQMKAGKSGGVEEWEESSTLIGHARTPPRAHAHTYTREGGGYPSHSPDSSGPVIGFDLETADADDLFRWNRDTDGSDCTEFVRLSGVVGPSGARQIVSVRDLLALLGAAGRIDGHNILGFDGLALAWHHGMDWRAFAAKARDTELIARQAKPPRSRESGSSQDRYDLDHVASELGVPGKTDELARLKRKHGGYHLIPADDPEYRDYLMGDLAATRAVADQLVPWYDADPYLPREHALAALAGQMTLNGFAVNHPLLEQRTADTAGHKRQALGLLHDGWGLPLDKAVLRGRGKDRHEEREALESPLAGAAGRAWLEAMYARYGITDPPRTAKARELAIGADDLAEVTSRPDCPGELRTMITLMGVATGARTVYQTATDWLCPDGRVHPKISMRQASGRWSFTKPGLTVYGKHEGRHVERDVYAADPGEVLVSFDLSQVDMRAIAGHCQDPAYMALFAPGRDVHAEIAVQVFGDAKRRQEAKARGHGWNYGMGPERMIRDGVEPALAYGFDNGMRNSFPVLCSWREQIREIGRQGMILDNGFGRRMRCEPRWAHTVAPALMGQGGARDIMCECLLKLPAWTWPMLRAMVHDEIILSVPPAALADVVRAVTAAMTWTWAPPGAVLRVPILCDINGPGLSWGGISGKCPECGKGAHGRGFCEIAASLKKMAARYEADFFRKAA